MLSPDCNLSRIERLMEVASILGLLTQKTDDFRRLARYLATAFNLPNVTLAVIKTVADGAMVLHSATSAESPLPTLEQEILDIHQYLRSAPVQDGPIVRPALDPSAATPAPTRDTIFSPAIDDQDRLLVIVRQHASDSPLTADTTECLQFACRQLARNLQALLLWNMHPQVIGVPFDRLTDREWIVLRNMNSDVGEKQLADQLGLSPHTLHSHIKSIYRKVGVQGRLALVRREEESLREYRLNRSTPVSAQIHTNANESAISCR